ncbi:MAG: hypothetical protein J6L85_04595 [Clostridia bacterium]|nr:hypothetical protein [Clostridia bacterium]
MEYNGKIDILKENLCVLYTRTSICAEQRELVLKDIARLICSQNSDSDLTALRDLYLSTASNLSAADELILYSEILNTPALSDKVKHLLIIGSEDATPAGSHGKIAYTKNQFNDLALAIMTDAMSNVKPLTVSSNIEACESVANGICEFCLLPVENTRDGKIFGFYSMLERYELKICNVCILETDHDLNNIKYALISKSGMTMLPRRPRNTNFVFEFSVINSNGDFIVELLEVAKKCGATLLSIDSRPIEYDPQLRRYLFGFLMGSSPLFRLYTALRYNGYSQIGLYPAPNNN